MKRKKRSGKQHPPTAEQLIEARRLYEAGTSLAEIARTIGVNRTTLIGHRNKGGWVAKVDIVAAIDNSEAELMRGRVKTNVIDMASRQAFEKVGVALADVAAVGLGLHLELDNATLALAKDTIEKVGRLSKEAILKRKLACELAQGVVETSRQVHGRHAGQPSVGQPEESKQRRVIFSIVAPPPQPPPEEQTA